jgi:histidyl-tRNA synthetase
LLKTKNIEHLPEPLREHAAAKELQKLLASLQDTGITNVTFDITLMRGFDYYTDVIFEVFDKNPENNRSMFGGGRYDGLVGLFGVEPVPTVGFGMGDVTLQNFLEAHDLLPDLRSETDVYVILIGDVYQKAQRVIREMRTMGLNVAVDLTDRKAEKQIKTATKKNIHYVLFIGEKELEDEQYTLRNLHTGAEEKHSASRIVSIAKDYRGKDDDL